MIIEKVTTCGFDKLYDMYQTSKSDKNNVTAGNNDFRAFYMKKRDLFLNNLSVSFIISDINIIETMMLRRMSKFITIKSEYISNLYKFEKNATRFNGINDVIGLSAAINDDSDIKDDAANHILPVGCIKYRLLCTFKGSGVLAVTNSFIEKAFVDGEKTMTEFKEEIINKNLANNLMANLYQTLQTTMYDFDQYTDFALIKHYFNYVNIDQNCIVSQINSPSGQVDLCGSDKTKLNNQVARLINNVKEHKESDIDFVVTICSTFRVFAEFFIKTDFVTAYEDLKVIANDEDINLPFDIKDKYSERIKELLKPIVEFRKNIRNDSQDNMHKPCLIIDGQNIKFNIKIPANIEELIKDGKFDVMDSSVVGDIVVKAITNINSIKNIYKNQL